MPVAELAVVVRTRCAARIFKCGFSHKVKEICTSKIEQGVSDVPRISKAKPEEGRVRVRLEG